MVKTIAILVTGIALLSLGTSGCASKSTLVWESGQEQITTVFGDRHCGTAAVQFLRISDTRFAQDPKGQMPLDSLNGKFEEDTSLPATAVDSGYRSGKAELWLLSDHSSAYIVHSDGKTERWPAVSPNYGCD